MNKQKNKDAKYLIITNGPTGSGKSGLVNKTISHYGLNTNYKTFLIDDLIENNQFYKDDIMQFISNECGDQTLCKTLENRFLEPDHEMYKAFNNLYFKYRGKTGEQWCNNQTSTCSQYLDTMLDNSIINGDNIIFETTGSYYVEWLINKVKDIGYNIVYAFTLLDFCENVKRNKSRTLYQAKAFISDSHSNPAPRLPNVEEEYFRNNVDMILRNLLYIIGRKIMNKLEDVEHVIVFDNSSRDIVTLYDSDTMVSSTHVFEAIENIRQITYLRKCTMR